MSPDEYKTFAALCREGNNRRFDDIEEKLDKVIEKVDAIWDFKTGILANSRFVSLFFSSIVGVVTFSATVLTVYLMIKGMRP